MLLVVSHLAIFNPISGAGKARRKADLLADAARRRGVPLDLQPTSPQPPETWLRPILADTTYEGVVVVGGDGAVRLVAPEAARAGVPLVHCPAGNENLFAREFGMTDDPDMILDLLQNGRRRAIDLLDVAIDARRPEVAVLMASFGFDAEVVHDLAARRTGPVSHLSYVMPLVRTLLRLSLPTVTAELDGEVIADRVPGFVLIANSRQYAARLDPARSADIDDGRLDLLVFPCRTRLGLLAWFLRTCIGRHLRHPRLIHRQGRHVELGFDPSQRWQVDGDPPHEGDPVSTARFSVRPGALTVLEPRPSGASGAENRQSG